MKQTASTLLFFLFCFTAQAASPKQPFWLGGKAGFSFPSNIGPTDGRLGFNEVAAVYRKDGRVEAFIGISEGTEGVYLLPFIHPDIV